MIDGRGADAQERLDRGPRQRGAEVVPGRAGAAPGHAEGSARTAGEGRPGAADRPARRTRPLGDQAAGTPGRRCTARSPCRGRTAGGPRSRSRGAPAEHGRVQGDHQGVGRRTPRPAGRLSTRSSDVGPVELEPAGHVGPSPRRQSSIETDAWFEKAKGSPETDRRRRARRRGRPPVRRVEYADRTGAAAGRGNRRPNSSTEVSGRPASAQHARHDGPGRSNAARLRPRGGLVAGPARDVGPGDVAHRRACARRSSVGRLDRHDGLPRRTPRRGRCGTGPRGRRRRCSRVAVWHCATRRPAVAGPRTSSAPPRSPA